ncbi:uncharacterized protein [Lolium perenne]|uniref:uncharacterized protein n=1 Tax=Lolium perenne TaxID=4522 RepID=UPI003A99E14C
MEAAPVTAATGALGPVITKLAALLGREYKLRWRTRRDVKSIRAKLKPVHSILWNIWEKVELDEASKVLKMDALDLADDVDDAIVDFILRLERSRSNNRLVQTRIEVSPFQDFKKRSSDVSGRCRSKWKKLFSCGKIPTNDSSPGKPRAYPFVHKDISELVGMVEPRDNLIRHLVGEDQTTPVELQLKTAFINGPAGMGKTTLAHLVYEEIGSKFESRAFVSVTPGSNIREVLASVLQQVDPNRSVQLAGTEEAEDLINIISNFLKEKRCACIKRVPLEKLEGVRVLDLCVESVVDQHLKDICGLVRLRHLLGLSGARISVIPPEIVRLQCLETLQASNIPLPGLIGKLQQLKTLEVSGTAVTELPREIRALQQLQTLRIRSTYISELPKEIEELQQLIILDIGNTRITMLPKDIRKLQQLMILDIGDTPITVLPKEIGKLQHLEHLLMMDTNVEKIPREIGGLKDLKSFEVGKSITVLPLEVCTLVELPDCIHQVLKQSDLLSELAREMLSFQKSSSIGLQGGLFVGAKQMHIPPWIKDHFNDIVVLDIRICKLAEQGLKILREMPGLEELTLRFEVVPKDPVVISDEGFRMLTSLTVDSRMPRMALPHNTKFYRLGNGGNMMFVKDIDDLSEHLGRPHPEFLGTQMDNQPGRELQWVITADLRGKREPPISMRIHFSVMESNWLDGLARAMQEALARLCGQHVTELYGTRFAHLAMHDSIGGPRALSPHPELKNHVEHLDVMLHDTEKELGNYRVYANQIRSHLAR